MIVDYHFLSYCDDNPAEGRWDQAWVTRMLEGDEWLPATDVTLRRADQMPYYLPAVIVFPCGHYAEHDELDRVVPLLRDDLLSLGRAVLIAASDECQTFPWHQIDPWPETVKLWVMLPRPENTYPPGTRFMGEGSPTHARDMPVARHRETRLVFFAGQAGHERREQCFAALGELERTHDGVVAIRTGGFTQGLNRNAYLEEMCSAWFAPAPAGICSPSSFRAYEALEAGAIPLVDAYRPGSDRDGFWDMLGLHWLRQIRDWEAELPVEIVGDPAGEAARMSSLWQNEKRQAMRALHADLGAQRYPSGSITAIVMSSPVRSHPDKSMILETIESIRDRAPGIEILVCCDGVRREQADLEFEYREYLRRLTRWTARQQNILPILFDTHRHQSGMMRTVLEGVDTDHVLFVEHDTPLEGDIDLEECVEMMRDEELALLRFSHEAGVVEGHEHLFLETTPGDRPYVRTVQFSARPHLARTDWYRDRMATYFGWGSRAFIEDVMHGVTQAGLAFDANGVFAPRKHVEAVWNLNRMAVYAPEGSWKRSGHLDGRGDEPKYDQFIKYDTPEVPRGAPLPGRW